MIALGWMAACVLVPVVALAAQTYDLPCRTGERECALKAVKTDPARKLAFWKSTFAKPVAERIGPAPVELVRLVALDNIANDFPNKPRVSKPAADFTADVKKAFAEMPEAVRRPLEKRLAGIYFVEDIGGTGFTDFIEGEGGKHSAGFILLDPAVLRSQTANAWATWRDGTPFKADGRHRLEVTLETAAQNNRKNAIQYILLHELAHVLSIGGSIHPSWDLEPKDVKSTREFPFFEQSWTITPGAPRFTTRFDAAFPQRARIAYYFGAKLEGSEMVATYAALERTNFPTLYAATHPGDDFAEAFANYVHVVMMKRPFEIRLYEGDKVAKRYASCWTQERCKEKRRLLEALLDGR